MDDQLKRQARIALGRRVRKRFIYPTSVQENSTREVGLKRNVLFQCICQGCNARLKIEFVSEPVRTGAMWTVDCPVCGTSKMIPDEPVKIFYEKDGSWLEAKPKSQHFG